ncbi:CBS domain-containing protein [Virgisporangium ochraceum]|nr:CBS domain-containing protein [Virgisporangium ochraceum]
MTVADVMTHGAVSATADMPYRDLVDLIETRSVNAVPVVDRFNRVVGVVSASDLLHKIEFAGGVDPPRIFESSRHRRDRRKSTGTVAAELMSAPAVTVMRTTPIADAARLMEETGVRRLPVIDIAGRLIGMVTNRDLLKVFLRPDDAIKRHVVDLFSTVDGGSSSVLSVDVTDGAVTLTGEVDRRTVAEGLTGGVEAIDGVVSVANAVTWLVDDTINATPVAGW